MYRIITSDQKIIEFYTLYVGISYAEKRIGNFMRGSLHL